MRITDFFKPSASHTKTSSVENQRAQEEERQKSGQSIEEGADKITISPLYRQISQISRVVSADEAAQADKVAELKAKVASGQYSVSSADVAQSLVAFAADSNAGAN